MRLKPEIMSPAGYWPQLNAAVEAGADAVYFGLRHFSARAKVGFTLDELPDVMRALHRRGVRGYVTFNTLVFDHELNGAAEALKAIAAAGADSVIVQDIGIAALVGQIAPNLAVHGSTQMSITSAEGIALAQRFGVQRVVMARELSLNDLRLIRSQTDCEMEIFAHGALCVSYSGQCFSSEAWGGRSANRGQCAQACRLPYDLLVDGRQTPLGDARYLLSPGDLMALEQIPEIIDIGISALKIEGRYKDEQYVALTTDAYRRAVDAAWEQQPTPLSPQERVALDQVYSRGSGPYFLTGTNHQMVVSGRAPRHRGVLLGRVTAVYDDSVLIEPTEVQAIAPLKPGDGLVFDSADWRSPEHPEEGGRLYEVRALGGELELRFGNRAIDFERIRIGDWLWRTSDANTGKAAKAFTQPAAPVARQPVQAHIAARVGEPLALTLTLARQPELTITLQTTEPLAPANRQGATPESVRAQLDRFGSTPYALESLTVDLDGEPFIPASLLNRLRQEAVERLGEIQEQAKPRGTPHPLTPSPTQAGRGRIDALTPQPHLPQGEGGEVEGSAFLHLLVRTPEQLDAALEMQPASITLDYLDLYGLRPAVERVQAAGIEARVASPRVLKPQEQRIVNFLLRLDCGILVRSGGLLEALHGRTRQPLTGDFSLNAANPLSARALLELGLARITPTHDLNADQIGRLAHDVGSERFEVIAYHHLPVFHTEHCVFCRFLSNGTSYLDCGHPCEKHTVALRDAQGRAHPVMADVGCRNTVFGAEAQIAARHMDFWRASGVRHFRLEFVHETGEQVRQIAAAFSDYLAGKTRAGELEQRLRAIAPQGVTQGSLFVPDDYLRVPVLNDPAGAGDPV